MVKIVKLVKITKIVKFDYSFSGVMCGNPPAPAVFAGYSTLAASGAAATAISYEKELQEFIKQTPLDGEYEKKMELFLLRVGKG